MGFHLEYDGEDGNRARSGSSDTADAAMSAFDTLLRTYPKLTNAEVYADSTSTGFGAGTIVATRADLSGRWVLV